MTSDDQALFAHYVERGKEAWNTSTDAAWLDFQLRDWVEPLIPARTPKLVCNVGIGVGLWDDWLGHVIGRRDRLISVDVDPDVCRMFALRQARERHPLPAEVVCGDIFAGALAPRAFDLVTAVGSTLDELGASRRADAIAAMVAALAPGGRVVVAELRDVVAAPLPPCAAIACRRHARRGELALALVAIERGV